MTIAKLAEAAGVSVPTVSKVLNGRSDVAPATRTRVEELIRRHGYRRRRGPGGGRAATVDLVFHELDSAWAIEVIRGVERVARAEGISVVLSESGTDPGARDGWVDSVLARQSVAVVLVFSDLAAAQRARLAARGIPLVIVDPTGTPPDDTPSIGSANWSGGLAATRHLAELGHTRVAMISGPPDVLCSRARIDGYRAALETAGLRVDPALLRTGDFHVEAGVEAGRRLLALADPPTAVFAGNDLQALGVYEAAREAGVRIPDDLSVVGYDDLPLARWVGPPLTTVRQPLTEMAEEATRLALSLSRGERPANLRLDLATSLVVRQSTAAPGRR
ncbi:LacI family DNA-binding transcriptional regulator [Marinitenerispora sediminis]|uniref:LacI family transcriptional regulator n=1 Tax=Marinitenerispora sediminis TaxID=1931232 RepID=A0A368T3V0_9ACTN|nr:LacI family DNA-binding transcriptional regulator [Marinitenerispora sediminis]RCV54101.1 LacI family transcriptional regulator [Marinitenerispora sediminis]RCV56824.1 LacI family transcriptional regulator [Marinitenerispora sediminis]RCV56947.1 LacI family transcriptional regulator [Marinitenerispora sediminis]